MPSDGNIAPPQPSALRFGQAVLVAGTPGHIVESPITNDKIVVALRPFGPLKALWRDGTIWFDRNDVEIEVRFLPESCPVNDTDVRLLWAVYHEYDHIVSAMIDLYPDLTAEHVMDALFKAKSHRMIDLLCSAFLKHDWIWEILNVLSEKMHAHLPVQGHEHGTGRTTRS